MRYIVLLALLAACGGDSNGPQLQPASFALVDGAAQVDTVGRELKEMIALRVIATDGQTAVPNYPISWTALEGGSVFATVVYSGTDGIARQRWTLGTGAGTQRLVARALDPETGAVLVDDTVTAVGMPDTAATFILSPWGTSTNVAAGDSVRISVEYRDRYNNQNAPCADSGDWARIAWSSRDSTVAVPTGTVGTEDTHRFAWVRGIAGGSTWVDGIAQCINSIGAANATTVTVTP